MERKTKLNKKIIVLFLIIINTFNSFGQIKFPYDSLKKAKLLIYSIEESESDVKPLERERIEIKAAKTLKHSFPAYKKFSITIGDNTEYSLESVSLSQYEIGVSKESEPFIRFLIIRKSPNSNLKFVTDDSLLKKIESAKEGQIVSITFETIPYGYTDKSTYYASSSIEGIEIYIRILSVIIE